MVEYTKAQKKAITRQGHDILVSASAGSGKTAVLVERVIEELKTIDVDQLLVVTFTRLAAQEMKDRIHEAIQAKIVALQAQEFRSEASKKELNHYRRQLNRVNQANISTIHAFCQQVIHKFYYLSDIDPEFTLLEDEAQATLLKQSVFEQIRETYYNQVDTTFFRLTENFSNDRDDTGLQTAIFEIYTYMRAFADPDAWLKKLSTFYENQPNLLDMPVFKDQILPEVTTSLEDLKETFVKSRNQFLDLGLTRHVDVLETYEKRVPEVATLKSYTALKDALHQMSDFKWPKFSKKEDVEKEVVDHAKIPVATGLADIEKLVELYFTLSEEKLREVNTKSQEIILKLVEVVQKFATGYQALKRQRGFLDFSDLEHEAYQILSIQDETGQYPVQAFYQEKFSEVLIDEYQDINPLQEALLRLTAAKNPGNRFMVGDIKQSIYGFRMAEPNLFATKYAHYQDDATEGPERIILADNFRSKNSVTDFVNYIFAQIMDQTLGGITYDSQAYLHFHADYYPKEDQPVEVLLAEKSEVKANPAIAATAQRIIQMIEKKELIYDPKAKVQRPIEYKDIAILVRSRSVNTEIVDYFKQGHIPVMVSDVKNYFKTTEIQVMLALLQLIDNLDQDIPLVAVLRSPMYHFDENELSFIRGNQPTKHASFYEAFEAVATQKLMDEKICQPDFLQRTQQFFTDMTLYRDMARTSSIADLIWTIYERTGFLNYVGGMPSGVQRQANLNALYDRAQSYEQNGFKGVFQFVRFIEQMQTNDKDLAQPTLASELENAVQVMTIHGSKGLEFPVVFSFGLEHQFNLQSLRQSYVLNKTLGIGMTYLTSQRVKVPTIQRSAAIDAQSRLNLAEELRLLYVAFTRAQQRLILVATVKEPLAKIDQWYAEAGTQQMLPLKTRLDAKCFLDFVGPALVRGIDQGALKPYYQGELFEKLPHQVDFQIVAPKSLTVTETKVATSQPQELIEVSPTFTALVKRRFTATYDYEIETETTAYQSVSDIKRQFDDPDLDTLVPLENRTEAVSELTVDYLHEPEFLSTTQAVSPAQIGTATHLVFQKIDLVQPVTLASIEATLQDLIAQDLLTEALAQKIQLLPILKFFKDTPLGQKICEQPNSYHREVTFSMVYPAEQLFSKIHSNQGGNVLIHGMMDGYYQTEDELILVDYKTDHTSNQKILDRYRGQLNLYALALAQMSHQPVSARYLYGFQNQSLILVP